MSAQSCRISSSLCHTRTYTYFSVWIYTFRCLYIFLSIASCAWQLLTWSIEVPPLITLKGYHLKFKSDSILLHLRLFPSCFSPVTGTDISWEEIIETYVIRASQLRLQNWTDNTYDIISVFHLKNIHVIENTFQNEENISCLYCKYCVS